MAAQELNDSHAVPFLEAIRQVDIDRDTARNWSRQQTGLFPAHGAPKVPSAQETQEGKVGNSFSVEDFWLLQDLTQAHKAGASLEQLRSIARSEDPHDLSSLVMGGETLKGLAEGLRSAGEVVRFRSLERAGRHLIQVTRQFINCENVSLTLMQGKGEGWLRLVAEHVSLDHPQKPVLFKRHREVGGGLTGFLAREERVANLTWIDMESDPYKKFIKNKSGKVRFPLGRCDSLLFVPLFYRKQFIGGLNLHNRIGAAKTAGRPMRFSRHDELIATIIGNFAASLLFPISYLEFEKEIHKLFLITKTRIKSTSKSRLRGLANRFVRGLRWLLPADRVELLAREKGSKFDDPLELVASAGIFQAHFPNNRVPFPSLAHSALNGNVAIALESTSSDYGTTSYFKNWELASSAMTAPFVDDASGLELVVFAESRHENQFGSNELQLTSEAMRQVSFMLRDALNPSA